MRALAEFIMRGRMQAAVVAALGVFIPLLSPATVALVTLRRGGSDGFFVLAWAVLPFVVMAAVDPQVLPLSFYNFSVLVAVIGGALVLRSQQNWPVSSIGLVVLAATGGLMFGVTFSEFNEQLVEQLNQAQEEARAELQQEGLVAEPVNFTPVLIAGAWASAIAAYAVFGLVIGRWWQAMLYNPGGFREEFQQFRLSRTQALLCFGFAALGLAQPNWQYWGWLAGVPLLLACAAVVHDVVWRKKAGLPWLVLFYLLVLFQPFTVAAVIIGFTDSWADYRRRIGPRLPDPKDGPNDQH